MRISKTRLAKLETMLRGQVVINDKVDELRRRMQSAQARVDDLIRGKLNPEDYDQYLASSEAYNTALYQRWAELRSTMQCRTLADKFKIADRAAELAIEQTGFNRPIV